MKLLILKNDKILEFLLPQVVYGDYWITDVDSDNHSYNLVNVKEQEGKWVVSANEDIKILKDGVYHTSLVLAEDDACTLEFVNIPQSYILYCAKSYEDTYDLFAFRNANELTIGFGDDNGIIYKQKLLTDSKVKLTYNNNVWTVDNLNGSNTVYVNEKMVVVEQVSHGDIIFLMGLRIIPMGNYLLINNPNNARSVNGNIFNQYSINIIEPTDEVEEDIELYQKQDYFFRSPRLMNKLITEVINIDPPPQSQDSEDMPLFLTMGSMMTMGMSSLISVYTAVSNLQEGADLKKTMPALILSISMLVGMLFIPLLSKRYQKRSKKKKEKYRQKKYSAYIEKKRQDILTIIEKQEKILHENHISLDQCQLIVSNKSRNLWERKLEHDDFLKLRLGKGNVPAALEIHYPEEHFTLDDDNLRADLYKLALEPKELKDVPICCSFTEKITSAILGERVIVQKFTENLLLQMMTFHSYEDLKIVVFTDQKNAGYWDYLKILPHNWSNNRSVRFFGSTMDDISQLSIYLMNEFNHRKFQDDDMGRVRKNNYKSYQPYYLIFVDNFMSVRNFDIIKSVLSQEVNYGFSLIVLATRLNELPNECNTFINVDEKSAGIMESDLSGEQQNVFLPEFNDKISMIDYCKSVANIPIELSKNRFDLPNSLSFLEMYRVGRVEQLNALNRWKENNPSVSLQAPVGVDENGELFKLDLHEKHHGPHGLVAGMTGSGKSEFIITYILSMAINYHPDEVSFVIIDYKGGGLAGAFENKETGVILPHLSGTITNLDSVEIKRNLSSIQSELKRRQRIFNEARNRLSESTIDIYKYQKLYRAGKVAEPVPHLIIVSDEFAELKDQQPEFMDQLISTARIGRSLGVHLILATQKPSGVVDDQIWSNAKFRVCLKVQDKSDSVDMIKCADAAALTNVGRFYLQVGYNEFFALGQSAWCGAPYYEAEVRKAKRDLSINFVNEIGNVVKSVEQKSKDTEGTFKGEELPNIIAYLQNLAKNEKLRQNRLWLERIPNEIFVEKIKKKYHYRTEKCVISPIIGEYDDPSNQKQYLLTLPLSTEGNTIIYGTAGSGKENLLNTIIYSCSVNYKPQEVNFYILDFGSETMRNFSKFPHVGDVVLSNEKEKIENLFKMLKTIMVERKKLFLQYNGSYSYYCKNSGKQVPLIVVMINNYEAFQELYSNYEDVLCQLTREGLKYGIVFILTTSGVNTVRYKLGQNFRQQLLLQLNDKYDYVSILGNTGDVYPSKNFGRGVLRIDGNVYEFQSALIYEKDKMNSYIAAISDKLKQKYSVLAPKIPILPEVVSLDFLSDSIDGISNIPVGVRRDDLIIEKYDLTKKVINNIMAYDIERFNKFLPSFILLLSKMPSVSLTILDALKLLEKYSFKNCSYYNEKFESIMNNLNQLLKDENLKGSNNVFVIVGLDEIKVQVGDKFSNIMNEIMESSKKLGNVNFVFVDVISNYKKIELERWYKTYADVNAGIWVGSGISDQYTLKLSKTPRTLSEEIPDNFGYVVKNGIPSLIKLIEEDMLINENDDSELL